MKSDLNAELPFRIIGSQVTSTGGDFFLILRYCTGKYEITVVHYEEDFAKTHEKDDLYSTVEACSVQAISALNASVVFFSYYIC